MPRIEIKEEGGCELYSIYLDGKLIKDGLGSENVIDIEHSDMYGWEIKMDGKKYD